MLLLNTPLLYIFCLLYTFLTLGLLSFSNSLLVIWILIELQIIMFIVISIPYFRFFHSSLILYFLIQSVCSLIVLAFVYWSTYFLFIALLINLGVFPFYGWYLSSLPAFPNLSLFLALTFQKLPSIFLFNLFFSDFSGLVVFLVIIFSFIGSLSAISSISSIQILLVWSSLVTNLWFFLGLSQSITHFLLYFFVYGVLIFCLLGFYYSWFSRGTAGFIVLIFSLGGFPPLPLFFVKLYILYHLACHISVVLVLLVLLSSTISMYIYCSMSLSSFLSNYSKI